MFDDFISGSGRQCLKQSALPSVFSWNQRQKHSSLTSKKALQPFTFDNHDNCSPADVKTDNVKPESFCDSIETINDPNCREREVLELHSKLANRYTE